MVKISKQKVIFLGALAAVQLTMPHLASAKTLAEAVRSAWNNHPSLTAAQAQQDYSASEIKEEYGAYFPELSLSAYGGRQYGDNATSRGLSVTRGEGYSNLWEGNATLRQGLFDAGGRDSRVDAAKIREDAATATAEDTKDILAHTVALSYMELLRVYQNLALIDKHRAKIDTYIGRIKQAVDNGAADEAEYKQALDMALVWEDQSITNETLLESAKAAYFEAVGEMPQGQLKTPPLPPGAMPASLNGAIAIAKDGHPALVRAQLDAQAAKFGIETEESGLFPTLDGELSYLKSDKKDLLGGEVTDARALLRMNWAFNTGGSAYQRIAKSKYRHAELNARYEELERQVERGVRLAYAEYDGAQKRLETQKKRYELAQNLLTTSQEQFEGARISLLQLMQAEDQAFQVLLENLNAQNQVKVTQYGILSAIGASSAIASGLHTPAPTQVSYAAPQDTGHAQ